MPDIESERMMWFAHRCTLERKRLDCKYFLKEQKMIEISCVEAILQNFLLKMEIL
jgi:hypothetical protein